MTRFKMRLGLTLLLCGLSRPALAAIATTDLTGGTTAADIAALLAGPGVAISNVTYTGAAGAAGEFTGGAGIIGFNEGVILSSGFIGTVIGPNTLGNASGWMYTAGDPNLTVLSGHTTYDAAVLEFDFVPDGDTVYFQYVFASEEYNEFVGSQFNDVFAFYVNGANCAVVGSPAVPVTINTINLGSNSSLYIDNTAGALDTQMDGLTTVLLCQAPVTPNASNHMKLAVADASDDVLDSAVFLRAASISTTPPATKCALSQGYWRTHQAAWPVDTLQLGALTYPKAELLALLQTPPAGDASLILAKQLIAAKLNQANGVNASSVAATITDADTLVSGSVPMHIKASSKTGQSMTADGLTLEAFNNNQNTSNCTP